MHLRAVLASIVLVSPLLLIAEARPSSSMDIAARFDIPFFGDDDDKGSDNDKKAGLANIFVYNGKKKIDLWECPHPTKEMCKTKTYVKPKTAEQVFCKAGSGENTFYKVYTGPWIKKTDVHPVGKKTKVDELDFGGYLPVPHTKKEREELVQKAQGTEKWIKELPRCRVELSHVDTLDWQLPPKVEKEVGETGKCHKIIILDYAWAPTKIGRDQSKVQTTNICAAFSKQDCSDGFLGWFKDTRGKYPDSLHNNVKSEDIEKVQGIRCW